MQDADKRMMASVGLRIFGSGTSSQRTSRAPCNIVPSIWSAPVCLSWSLRVRFAQVLFVRNFLHPVDGAAVELLGDGDVRHGRGGGRPVPMLLAGREPHDVAGPDLLNRAALALRPAQPRCDDQRLTERMRVPGCPRARFKC